MKKYYVTNREYKMIPEKNTGISVTIPGQSYTVKELIERFQNGVMPEVVRDVAYQDEPDIDNPDITQNPDFDLSDVTEALLNLNEAIEAMKQAPKPDPVTVPDPVVQ